MTQRGTTSCGRLKEILLPLRLALAPSPCHFDPAWTERSFVVSSYWRDVSPTPAPGAVAAEASAGPSKDFGFFPIRKHCGTIPDAPVCLSSLLKCLLWRFRDTDGGQ
jgi:hypothetical protein